MKVLRTKLAIGMVVAPFTLLPACSPGGDEEVPEVSASAQSYDADNSQRNERDRSGSTLDPVDQGNSDLDLSITRVVRKRVMDQDGFSIDAKNVKIITRDAVVTLRGPVATAEERAQIGALAATVEGVKQVDNQLEVELR